MPAVPLAALNGEHMPRLFVRMEGHGNRNPGNLRRSLRKTAARQLTKAAAGFTSVAPAQMAELVDALVSGTSAARRGGSSPLLGTKKVI
jgi:hypothetical protein